MEENYWEQFMGTGRIEDYLLFKGVSDRKDSNSFEQKERSLSEVFERGREWKEKDKVR